MKKMFFCFSLSPGAEKNKKKETPFLPDRTGGHIAVRVTGNAGADGMRVGQAARHDATPRRAAGVRVGQAYNWGSEEDNDQR